MQIILIKSKHNYVKCIIMINEHIYTPIDTNLILFLILLRESIKNLIKKTSIIRDMNKEETYVAK